MLTAIRRTFLAVNRRQTNRSKWNSCKPCLDALDPRLVPTTNLYVTQGGDSGAGSLRAALASVFDNDPTVIHIEVSEIGTDSELFVPESGIVEIVGENGKTDIHPNEGEEHSFRGMSLGIGDGGTFELNNLSFTNFAATGAGMDADGGAVLNDGTLTVVNCFFAGNTAPGNGGALASLGLDLTVSDSSFGSGSDPEGRNVGYYGGAIYFAPNGGVNSLEVSHCFFTNNQGTYGGAIASITNGTTYIGGGSVFAINGAPQGGAIWIEGGIQQVVDSQFEMNSALAGGFGPPADGIVYMGVAASVWTDGLNFDGTNSANYDVVIEAPQSTSSIFMGGNIYDTDPPYIIR